MSLYLLDTDTLTLFQKGHPAVARNIIKHVGRGRPTSQPIGEVAITVISVEEQLTGWYSQLRRHKQPDKLAWVYLQLEKAVKDLALFAIVSLTAPAIVRYDQLSKMKINIGKMDLRIAAIVLENNATVVTRNLRDFQRVPNLTVEDWSV